MDNLRLDFEFSLTLHFELIKAEMKTQDYPGHPGSVDITAISIEGVEVSAEVFKRLMNLYGDVFYEEIFDKAAHSERGDEIQFSNIFYKTFNKKGDTHV